MRVCIYPKDVAVIMGYSEGHSRRILRQIKKDLDKDLKSKVSISEFCDYMNLPYDDVSKSLNPTSKI